MKKVKSVKWFGLVFIGFSIFMVFNFLYKGMDKEIPPKEQEYIYEVLDKINADSSKEDVIKLLGEPDRNLGLKVNWWVTVDGNKDRVGVYFSETTGKATAVNFDGGSGRFYYRKNFDR
ncbi:hypothetical protein [Clostridium intestinale]|uniref:hypothetical protein n=1 Tax=Clostridium intestinale TaxID=36845 RepID=UPI002DD67755|nr:hypothetical protein [Clostridium intestinale]WRY52693.1 hypothetical protein P8F83_05710 [Clostridium intestinale]